MLVPNPSRAVLDVCATNSGVLLEWSCRCRNLHRKKQTPAARPKPAGRRFGEQRRLSGHPVEGKQCGSNRCWLLSLLYSHNLRAYPIAGGEFGCFEDRCAHDIIAAQRHDAKEVSCFRQVRVPHDAMIMQNARGLLLRYFERCHCRSPASAWGQVKAGGQTTEGRFHFCRRRFSSLARSRRTRSAGRASTRSERPSSLPEAHPGTQGTYVL
jgi:hypothetical protein